MILLNTLTLPDGLLWSDEFEITAITQSIRRRLDGGLTVYPRQLTSGRPITLEATPDHWLTRADARELLTMAAVVGGVFDLSLRDQAFVVAFRHHDHPALDLKPMIDFDFPADSDPVIGTIKLMTL
jgi:hypothetical protein